MRLINPGAGELTDRLTILALKILHGTEAGRDLAHFKAERDSLLASIRTRTLNGSWFEQVLDLAATNAALWDAEDDLRALREEFDQGRGESKYKRGDDELALAVLPLAFRIQSLNDARTRLVEAINKLTGELYGQEKV